MVKVLLILGSLSALICALFFHPTDGPGFWILLTIGVGGVFGGIILDELDMMRDDDSDRRFGERSKRH